MLQGAIVTEQPKSISAVKPKREGGHARAKKRFRGHNVMWKRITTAFDDDLKKLGANPAMVAPLSRWVLFQHLTKTQGGAGRRYADIIRNFERFTMPPQARSPRSANLEPARGAEDTEIQRRILNGTIEDYEDQARYAKSQYKRLMKVMASYADPITGRNLAKDSLDTLCLADTEPPAEYRPHIAIVLTAIAKEFGIGEWKKEKSA